MSDLYKASWMPLSQRFWVSCTIIALARMKTNDPIRAANRSRGKQKNILNDIQGAAGELLCVAKAENDKDWESINHDIYSVRGPVDDVDLVLQRGQEILRLESKCLIWDRNKKFFLINKEAHARSLKRNAKGYILAITRLGGEQAYISSIVSVESIDKWTMFDAGYGDPALSIELPKLATITFNTTWNDILEKLSPNDEFVKYIETVTEMYDTNSRFRAQAVSILTSSTTGNIRDLSEQLYCCFEAFTNE